MGRYASDKGGGDFKQAPAGNHVARCVKLIDIGTQHGQYQGEPTVRNQVIVQWELPDETMEINGETKPLIVSKFYTNSLNEKAKLRADLESWRGRPFSADELKKFDLNNILGAACMVNVVINDKGKATVASVSPLPKRMTCAEAFNKPTAFWLDEFDDNAFASLPEGFKRLIEQSDEYKDLFSTGNGKPKQGDGYDAMRRPDAEETDEIPF